MAGKGRIKGSKNKPGGKKPGPKFSPTHKEEVLAEVAKMDRRSYSQYQIAAALGLTQPTVSYYLAKVREAYREVQLSNRAERVAEKLAQLAEVRQEAWDEYLRSKEDAIRKTHKEYAGVNGLTVEDSETTEGRIAANAFLQTILNTLAQERELLGLDPEKKPGDTNVNLIMWDNLFGREPRPNSVEERLRQEQINLLPPAKGS